MSTLLTALWFISNIFSQGQSSSKAMEEITQVSNTWEVSEKKGTVQYELKLVLNSNTSGTVGTIRGNATITKKGKKYTITFDAKLTRSKYMFITKYPAIRTTFEGTKKSSDSNGLPLNENIKLPETLILKNNTLCPKSMREFQKCMIPVKK